MTAKREKLSRFIIGDGVFKRVFLTRMISRWEFDEWEREFKTQKMTGRLFNIITEHSMIQEKKELDDGSAKRLKELEREMAEVEEFLSEPIEVSGGEGKKVSRGVIGKASLLQISTVEVESGDESNVYSKGKPKSIMDWLSDDIRTFEMLADNVMKYISMFGKMETDLSYSVNEWVEGLQLGKTYTKEEIKKELGEVIRNHLTGENELKKSNGAYGVKVEDVRPVE